MEKAGLRREYLAKRKGLSATEVERRSQLITRHVFAYLNETSPAPAIVHCFLPIRRNNEVNTWPIIHGLWEKFDYIQISVPVTDWSMGTLLHYIISADTVFSENRLGIPEPLSATPLTYLHLIDTVLVPLLAFDRQGHRVGYGGGYYDRFLAECRPDCQKVGLSLFEPVDLIDGIEPTDIQLDACVTYQKIYLF